MMNGLAKNYRYYERRLKNEGVSYLFDLIRSRSKHQTRLLIFGQGRSGSTLLESLICSTGYFSRNGELLSTDKNPEIIWPAAYVRGLAKRQPNNNFIFHTKIYHLTRDRKHSVDPVEFLRQLSEDHWKIIYLRRRNKLRHALSNIVAEKKGYHKFNDEQEEIVVSVDCNKLVNMINGRLQLDLLEKETLEHIEHHEVVYEDDLEKSELHQETIDRILDFIGLESRPVSTNHRKVNFQPLDQLIQNYDEFVACITQEKWAHFLD